MFRCDLRIDDAHDERAHLSTNVKIFAEAVLAQARLFRVKYACTYAHRQTDRQTDR